MGLIKKFYAVFFDDDGDEAGVKKFNRKNDDFKYKDKRYIIDLKNASSFTRKGFLIDKTYFIYPYNNPSPYLLDKKVEPIMNAKAFNYLMETKVIAEVNKLDKSPLMELLTPRNIIIAIAVLGGIWYLASGGKIT